MADDAAAPGCAFEREHGCSEAEWRYWLPQAVHGHAFALEGAAQAVVRIGAGRLTLRWQALEPRRIALLALPRLAVRYVFDGVDTAARERFLDRFDAHLRRGGG